MCARNFLVIFSSIVIYSMHAVCGVCKQTLVVFYRQCKFSIMRRAAEEAKKAETSKGFEPTPSIIYLLLYNGAQALGLVTAIITRVPNSQYPSRDDWSFMGAICLHAKLSANVISIFSKISGSIQNHGASK